MKLVRFLLSFTLTCLIGGALYIGYKNNFWNVFSRIKEENPQSILKIAFDNLKNSHSAQVTGTLNRIYPLKSKDNTIKKDLSIDISTKFDGQITFPDKIDLQATIDASSLQKILPLIIYGDAVKKLTKDDVKKITLSIRTSGQKSYYQFSDLWQGWVLQDNTVPIDKTSAQLTEHIVLAQEVTNTPQSAASPATELQPTITSESTSTNSPEPAVPTKNIDSTSLLTSLLITDYAQVAEIPSTTEDPNNPIQEFSINMPSRPHIHPLLADLIGLNKSKGNVIAKVTIDKSNKIIKNITFKFKQDNTVAYDVITQEFEKTNTQRISDLRKIQLALEDYYDSKGKYPKTNTFADLKNTLVPDFLSSLPRNPQGDNYRYKTNDDATYYEIDVQLDSDSKKKLPKTYKVTSPRIKTNVPALLTPVATQTNNTPITPDFFDDADTEFTLSFESFNQDYTFQEPQEILNLATGSASNVPKTTTFAEVSDELISLKKADSRDSQRINDLRKIEKTLLQYNQSKNEFPVAAKLIESTNDQNPLKTKLIPTFLPTLPTDPVQNRWYGYQSINGKNFLLTSVFENPLNPYGEVKTNYTMYRITDLIPGIDTETKEQKSTFSYLDIFDTIPILKDIPTLLQTNNSTLTEASTSTPISQTSATAVPPVSDSTPLLTPTAILPNISNFENQNVQKITFSEQKTLAYGITAYVFKGELKDPTIPVEYWLNATSGEVLRRTLLNQSVADTKNTPDQAKKTAENFAQKHFQDFDLQNFELTTKNPDQNRKYYKFTWIRRDIVTQAILPTQVQVEINPTTGNPDTYAAIRVKLSLDDTQPAIGKTKAEEDATSASKNQAKNKDAAFKIVETTLSVEENPQNPTKQVLVWKIITWQDNNSTVGDTAKGEGFTTLINADTGTQVKSEKYPPTSSKPNQ
ncbi:MAG: hypothetical protein WCP97_02535 [bacterium]